MITVFLYGILGAGLYTFIYIGARAAGKYCGARAGATLMKMPETVRKNLGLTLLPHSGVSPAGAAKRGTRYKNE